MPTPATSPAPWRCAAVWGITTLGVGSLHGWLLPAVIGTPRAGHPRLGFEDLLVAGCELAALACTAWLWLLVTLVVLDLLRGRDSVGRRGVPPALRRVVLAGCGLSLAGSFALPAQAGEVAPHPENVAEALVGLRLPDRTTSTTAWVRRMSQRPPPGSAAQAQARREDPTWVRVRPGDTLWQLAAETLPAGAGDAEVDRRWQEIYRLNRSVIGADPDLIRPGQRLLLPPTRPREEPR